MATTLTGALEPKVFDRSNIDTISKNIGNLSGVNYNQKEYKPMEGYNKASKAYETQFGDIAKNKLSDPFKNNQAWGTAKQNTMLATTGQDTAAKSMQAGMDEKQALQKAATLGNQNIQNQAMGLGAGQASALGMQAQRDINSQQAQQQGQLTGQLLNRADNATNQLANIGRTEAAAQTQREQADIANKITATQQAAAMNEKRQQTQEFYDKIGLTQEQDRLKADQWNKEFELGKLKTQADLEKMATDLGISTAEANLMIDKWNYNKNKDFFQTVAANTDFTNPDDVAQLKQAYSAFTGIPVSDLDAHYDTMVNTAWDQKESNAGDSLATYSTVMNTSWVDDNGNPLSSEQVMTSDPKVLNSLDQMLYAESGGDDSIPRLNDIVAKKNSGQPLTAEEQSVYDHAVSILDQTRKSPTAEAHDQAQLDFLNALDAAGYTEEQKAEALDVWNQMNYISQTGGVKLSTIPGVEDPVLIGPDGNPLVMPDGVSDFGTTDSGVKYTRMDDGTTVITQDGEQVKLKKKGDDVYINKDGKWTKVSNDDENIGTYQEAVGIDNLTSESNKVTVEAIKEDPTILANKSSFTPEEEDAVALALFSDPTNIDKSTIELIKKNPALKGILYNSLSKEEETIGKSSNTGNRASSRRTFTGQTSKGTVVKVGNKYYIVAGDVTKSSGDKESHGGNEYYEEVQVLDPATGEIKTLNSYDMTVS